MYFPQGNLARFEELRILRNSEGPETTNFTWPHLGSILQGKTVKHGRDPISATNDKPIPRQRAKQVAKFQRPNAKRGPRHRARHASHNFSDQMPSACHDAGRNGDRSAPRLRASSTSTEPTIRKSAIRRCPSTTGQDKGLLYPGIPSSSGLPRVILPGPMAKRGHPLAATSTTALWGRGSESLRGHFSIAVWQNENARCGEKFEPYAAVILQDQ